MEYGTGRRQISINTTGLNQTNLTNSLSTKSLNVNTNTKLSSNGRNLLSLINHNKTSNLAGQTKLHNLSRNSIQNRCLNCGMQIRSRTTIDSNNNGRNILRSNNLQTKHIIRTSELTNTNPNNLPLNRRQQINRSKNHKNRILTRLLTMTRNINGLRRHIYTGFIYRLTGSSIKKRNGNLLRTSNAMTLINVINSQYITSIRKTKHLMNTNGTNNANLRYHKGHGSLGH